MTKLRVHMDFETYSTVDLRRQGLHNYARDPSTGVWCLAYCIGKDPVNIKAWDYLNDYNEQGFPDELVEAVTQGAEVHGWNVMFEYEIWNLVLRRRFPWLPELRLEQLRDTMAGATSMGFPVSLDAAARALRLPIRKDRDGHSLMLRMCRPREYSPVTGLPIWWDDTMKLDRLIAYCQRDVETEMLASQHLAPLTSRELEFWRCTQRMNLRGVSVDHVLAEQAASIIGLRMAELTEELKAETSGKLTSVHKVAEIKRWVETRIGRPLPNLDKHMIAALLGSVAALLDSGEYIGHDVCRVLSIRQEAGRSSVSKITAMQTRCDPSTFRLHGSFMHNGAGSTGRWTAVGVQLQNLFRKTLEPLDAGLSLIRAGDIEGLRVFFGPDIFKTIAMSIRPMLCAAEGKILVVRDWSQVESRITAWLAGDEAKLEVFRQGRDIYQAVGSGMFGIPEDLVVGDLRQSAKTAELACCFAGGPGALAKMAEIYGLSFTEDERIETVRKWREANPKTCAIWEDILSAAMKAMKNPFSVFPAAGGKLRYQMGNRHLSCILPSGRRIYYPFAHMAPEPMPWDPEDIRDTIHYYGLNQRTRQWDIRRLWRGLTIENAVQAIGADLMREALLAMDEAGLNPVLTIHDEGACEVPDDPESVSRACARIDQIMETAPWWAKGLPLAADGYEHRHFHK